MCLVEHMELFFLAIYRMIQRFHFFVKNHLRKEIDLWLRLYHLHNFHRLLGDFLFKNGKIFSLIYYRYMFLPHSDSFLDISIGNPETITTPPTKAKQIIKFILLF